MQKEGKRIARVLQPVNRRKTTEMSPIGLLLFGSRRLFAGLSNAMAEVIRLFGSRAGSLRSRNYIPLAVPPKVQR